MKTVGLFFGSFNPIHIGHLAIANYFAEFTDLDEVWFVPSPQNPLKSSSELASTDARVQMLKIAVENQHPKIKICLEERHLPTPSYTLQTVIHLKRMYPNTSFTLIIGDDSLQTFHLWQNFKDIVQELKILVYPRNTSREVAKPIQEIPHTTVEAPQFDISSTQIRSWLANHCNVCLFLPKGVYEYIIQNNLYQV